MGNRKHYLTVSVLVVVGAVIVYFVLRAIYQLPLGASEEATTIDGMFDVYFGLIAFMFTLIMVFMLYAVFVFRRQPGDEEDAAHIHGNMRLEIIWTIIPVILVVSLGVWGASTLSALTSERPNEMVVKVTGQQWAWSFAYPEQQDIVSSELVLPVGQPVLLEMTSRDVLHSFWVPEFRVKQDLLPGRETSLRITPTETGDYKLRCAEICGLSHTQMLADVRVVSRGEFDAWVQENQAAPIYAELTPEERGEIWYGADNGFGCVGCHSINGDPKAGPTWLGIFGRQEALEDGTTVTIEEAYLRTSILDPNAQIVAGFAANIMPQTYEQTFLDKQAEILGSQGVEIDIIKDILAFMATLEE